MKTYMLDRFNRRMQEAHLALGSVCVRCGNTEKLQLDHIYPEIKNFTIGDTWNVSENLFWEEVAKCQLLCPLCHNLKTLKENNKVSAKGTHGTLSSYRYCHCSLCKEAKRIYTAQYRKTYGR